MEKLATDCETGETTRVPLSPEEVAQVLRVAEEAVAKDQELERENDLIRERALQDPVMAILAKRMGII